MLKLNMVIFMSSKLKNMNKNFIGLMGTYLMNDILFMFLNTFMVAYFITLTNYDYKIISLYYMVSFVFIIFTFLLLGRTIKNKNQIYIFRLGIILHCAYILILALLKADIVNYYMFLGAFYGIVQGVFWASGHTLINGHVGNNSDNFISIKSIIGKLLKILFPIVFGVSIEITSFSYIAKIVLLISIIQLIFSFLVTDEQIVNKNKYNLNDYIKKLKKEKKLCKYYQMICCDGIVSYLLDTLITIIIVMTFKTTISLGVLTTLFSICSIISVFIYQNKIKKKEKILWISSVAMIISVSFLLFNINKTTVIIYNLCAGIFLVLLRNNAQAKRYNIISNYKELSTDFLVEHQVVSEVLMNLTRILGYGLLFIASLFNNLLLFKILLVLVTMVIFIYSKLMINLERKK